MNKPKILLIYPHNIFENTSGINSRNKGLVSILAQKYDIHLLGERGLESNWENYPANNNIITELFLHDFTGNESIKGKIKKIIKQTLKAIGVIKAAKNSSVNLKTPAKGKYIDTFYDYAFPSTFALLDEIEKKYSYEVLIIAYPFWGKLVKHKLFKSSEKIIFVDDFQTAQLTFTHQNVKSIGNLFEKEIELISLFDKAICISNQEMWLFSMFIPKTNFFYIPHFLPSNFLPSGTGHEFDLLFVGSDNSHNINGINWFITNVWKLLPESITLCVVGKVSGFVQPQKGITLIPYAESLLNLYERSRIIICPLQSGTGMKIKVVEALSFGKPVVGTFRALDGFIDYSNNGCLVGNNPSEFAGNIMKLISDNRLHQKFSEEAKQYFKDHFEKEKISKQLLTIFDNEE